MAPRWSFPLLSVIVLQLLVARSCANVSSRPPRVLIISTDGFRYDYLKVAHKFGIPTPNFDRMIAGGVSIKEPGLTNVFITKTVPNHYTMVTGLYPESHGVVANSFFDPLYNETFAWQTSESSSDVKWWNGTGQQPVKPVWVTNEASGENRSSGVLLWPGGDAVGQRPKYFQTYANSSTASFKSRIDSMIDLFTRSEDPINFGAMFYQEPDKAGHRNGPDTVQVARSIADIDAGLGHLFAQMDSKNLTGDLNVIFTSDHGMLLVEDSNSIYLDRFVEPDLYKSYVGSPTMLVLPEKGREEEVYRKLRMFNNLTVYKKEEVPADLHYSNNRRITPIIVVAPLGYRLCRTNATCDTARGNHGWDSKVSAMHPIFIATGPAFKKNYVADPFGTINMYSLLCHLLGINPRPNNGSVNAVRHILNDNSCPSCQGIAGSSSVFPSTIWISASSVIAILSLGRLAR